MRTENILCAIYTMNSLERTGNRMAHEGSYVKMNVRTMKTRRDRLVNGTPA